MRLPPLSHLPLSVIGFYRSHRRTVFAFIPAGSCRFTPTCSEYSKTSYERFGFFWGTALTGWRLLRCNPFVPGGFDLVPDRRERQEAPEDKTGANAAD